MLFTKIYLSISLSLAATRMLQAGDLGETEAFAIPLTKEEIFAEYHIDDDSRVIADRLGRKGPIPVGNIVTSDLSLPALAFPSPKAIRLSVLDLPPGPMSMLFYLFPKNKTRAQVIRSSDIMQVGIDDKGFYYASRLDDDRNPQTVRTSRPLETHRWQCVAVVYTGSAIRLFVDGVEDGKVPCSGRKSSYGNDAEYLGSSPDGQKSFVGLIAAFSVYNRPLNGLELQSASNRFQRKITESKEQKP